MMGAGREIEIVPEGGQMTSGQYCAQDDELQLTVRASALSAEVGFLFRKNP